MRSFSNTTTNRLEASARAVGLDLGIVKSPENAAGVFFAVRNGDTLLPRWVALGWTRDEAIETIRRWNAPSIDDDASGGEG